MPGAKTRRALGYARVSSAEQALGTSLQDQQNVIRAEASRRGIATVVFYVEAESGIREKQERREQMRALLRDVRAGDLVLCDKLDRWSRDTEFTLRSVREIREVGASFFAVGDHCDPSTPDGDFMLTMRAAMAKEEVKRIKVRLVGTRKLLRDAGYYVEGLPPYGYTRAHPVGYKGVEKNILKVDEVRAKVVKKVFALCISGRSVSKIGEIVELTRDRVFSVLRSRHYTGEVQNAQGEWIKGRHEAIIDAHTFEQARVALVERKLGSAKPRSAPSETSVWILRDVAFCTCGARMSSAYAGPHGAGRRYYYRCSRKCGAPYVPVRAVEVEAETLVVERLIAIRDELARPPTALVEAKPMDNAAKRAKLAGRREAYLEQHAEGLIDTSALKAKLATIDEALLRLDAAEAGVKPSPLSDKTVRRMLLKNVEVLRSRWSAASRERKRQIVTILATRVTVATDQPPRPVWRAHEDLLAEVG